MASRLHVAHEPATYVMKSQVKALYMQSSKEKVYKYSTHTHTHTHTHTQFPGLSYKYRIHTKPSAKRTGLKVQDMHK